MSVREGLARPLTNRVTPFGEIVAHPARGMLMGNRGCLNDQAGRIVRPSPTQAWISCLPTWPGTNRQLMRPGHYTELFFLDEPTALAAGHRPCGQCRPDQLRAFKRAWQLAHDLDDLPGAAEMDRCLRGDHCIASISSLDRLPDGALIAVDHRPLLRWQGAWLPWTFAGYGLPEAPDASWAPTLLTPTPMIEMLRAGYRPLAHHTADRISDDPPAHSWCRADEAAVVAVR